MDKKEEKFSGYDFDREFSQKRMKYVVISQGGLDINNAYAVESDEELLALLKDDYKEPIAIIKIDKFIKFTKKTEEIVKVELKIDAVEKESE